MTQFSLNFGNATTDQNPDLVRATSVANANGNSAGQNAEDTQKAEFSFPQILDQLQNAGPESAEATGQAFSADLKKLSPGLNDADGEIEANPKIIESLEEPGPDTTTFESSSLVHWRMPPRPLAGTTPENIGQSVSTDEQDNRKVAHQLPRPVVAMSSIQSFDAEPSAIHDKNGQFPSTAAGEKGVVPTSSTSTSNPQYPQVQLEISAAPNTEISLQTNRSENGIAEAKNQPEALITDRVMTSNRHAKGLVDSGAVNNPPAVNGLPLPQRSDTGQTVDFANPSSPRAAGAAGAVRLVSPPIELTQSTSQNLVDNVPSDLDNVPSDLENDLALAKAQTKLASPAAKPFSIDSAVVIEQDQEFSQQVQTQPTGNAAVDPPNDTGGQALRQMQTVPTRLQDSATTGLPANNLNALSAQRQTPTPDLSRTQSDRPNARPEISARDETEIRSEPTGIDVRRHVNPHSFRESHIGSVSPLTYLNLRSQATASPPTVHQLQEFAVLETEFTGNSDVSGIEAHVASSQLPDHGRALAGIAEIDPEILTRTVTDTIRQHMARTPAPSNDLGDTSLRIDLDPPELGAVTVKVSGNESVIRIQILADQPFAHALLEKNIDSLIQSFEETEGRTLDVDVSHRDSHPQSQHDEREQSRPNRPAELSTGSQSNPDHEIRTKDLSTQAGSVNMMV